MDYLQTRGKIKIEHKEIEAIAMVKIKAKREILLLDEVTVPIENSLIILKNLKIVNLISMLFF
jgi:hypothetical protein